MTDTMRMKAILVLVAALAFASAPFWSGGFGGFDPDRFPVPQIDPPAQPAGYAFSIWGLIYLWLIAHAGWGLLRRSDDARWDETRWPLLFSLVGGAGWIAVAQVSPLAALALIWLMLVQALLALFAAPTSEPWWLSAPLSVYAGWLTAASFVSVAINGAGFGIGPGALAWAWIAVAGLAAFAGAVQMKLGRVWGYGLAVAWAFLALAVSNWGTNTALAVVAVIAGAGFALAPAIVRDRRILGQY